MLLSRKIYMALLWGVSVLSATGATTTQTTSINSTAAHKVTETTVPPTKETGEAIATSRSDGTFDLVAMNTVAATMKSTDPPLHHTTAAVKTTAGIAHPSHNKTISKATEDAKHQQPPTAMTVTATATVATNTTRQEVAANVSPTTSPAKSSSAPVFNKTPSGPSTSTSPSKTTLSTSEAVPLVDPTYTTNTELRSTSQSTTGHEVTSKVSPTTSPKSSQAPVFIQTISSPTAPHTTTRTTLSTSEAVPVVGPRSTISTELRSTSQSSTEHEVTSKLSPTTSPAKSSQAPVFIQTLSSPSASKTTTRTTLSTSEAAPVLDPTSTTSSSMSTSKFHDRTVSSEMSKSTDSPVSTTNISSLIGILNPHTPTRLPLLTTQATVATTAPQPCSTRGVVKHCLIAIASLAALATVFMVLTIVLCTKLSARKYKLKKPQPATEMMCISSLLPERNHGYSRQRNPVTNGVLVIHGGADSDEDGEDNLTLSSFLPENDRFV